MQATMAVSPGSPLLLLRRRVLKEQGIVNKRVFCEVFSFSFVLKQFAAIKLSALLVCINTGSTSFVSFLPYSPLVCL